LAMTGFSMNAVTKVLRLRVSEESRRFVVCAPTGWAEVKYSPERGLRWTMRRGEISLMRAELAGLAFKQNYNLALNGLALAGQLVEAQDGAAIEFARPVVIERGDVLSLSPDRDSIPPSSSLLDEP
jgi:hypothetical protein